MKLARLKGGLADRADARNAAAETARNTATIDYIAIMTGVDIPVANEIEGSNDAQ